MSIEPRTGNRSHSQKNSLEKSDSQSSDEESTNSKKKVLSTSKVASTDEEVTKKSKKSHVEKAVSLLFPPIDITVLESPISRAQISLMAFPELIRNFPISSQRSIEIERAAETYDELESVITSHFTSSSVILMCSSFSNNRGTAKYSALEILHIPEQCTSSSSASIVVQDIVASIIRYTSRHEDLKEGKIAVLFFPFLSTEDIPKNHTGNNAKVFSEC